MLRNVFMLLFLSCLVKPEKGLGAFYDIQFFGDTYLPRHVLNTTQTTENNLNLFSRMEPLFRTAAVNVVNLEAPVTTAFVPFTSKRFHLRMPPTTASLLRHAGIHGVTLANNHTMDFGEFGLTETLLLLESQGIKSTGAGRNLKAALEPMQFQLPSGKYCILAFSQTLPEAFWATANTPGTVHIPFEDVAAQVRECHAQGSITVATFHWGQELAKKPKAYQRQLARIAIDAGASLVIGHHPHVTQTVEFYRGQAIFYSIGNFAFGSRPIHSAQEGIAVAIKRMGDKLRMRINRLEVNNKIVHFIPRLKARAVNPDGALSELDKHCRPHHWSWTCSIDIRGLDDENRHARLESP